MLFQRSNKEFEAKIDLFIKQLLEYEEGEVELLDYSIVPQLLQEVRTLFNDQPTLLNLYPPIKIVGSLYGHFQSLVKIFEFCGSPSQISYLFLGNYVDIGTGGLQTLLLLLAYKAKYPKTFFLLRGHHENSYMNTIYGFRQECERKTSLQMWEMITAVYPSLPYACVIDQKIFCVSGGIGPEVLQMKQIESMERGIQFMAEGVEGDLLWSEPLDLGHNTEKNIQGYGIKFSRDIIERFLFLNGLQIMCRSKQLLEQGFQFIFDKSVLSIFSAAKFKNQFDNPAAIISLNSDLLFEIQLYYSKKSSKKSTDII